MRDPRSTRAISLAGDFSRLDLVADPNLLDPVSGKPIVQAARNRFHLGQLGHGTV